MKWWKHYKVRQLRRKVMADFSKLDADLVQLKSDAEALIAEVGVEDPAIQVGIDAASAQVVAIDAEIKAKLP